MDEAGKWVVGLFAGLVHAILWWAWKKQDKRLDDVELLANTVELANKDTLLKIAAVELNTAVNFSSKTETQASIGRVHDQMEAMRSEVTGLIKDLRADIKQDITNAINSRR